MRIVFILFTVLMVDLVPLVGAEEPVPGQMTVKDLRRQGWTVAETSNRNETRPGLPPYEHLSRVVSITNYTLVRGDETITCEIIYDSQRDSLQEDCIKGGS